MGFIIKNLLTHAFSLQWGIFAEGYKDEDYEKYLHVLKGNKQNQYMIR